MLAYTFPNLAQAMYRVFSDLSMEGLVGFLAKEPAICGPFSNCGLQGFLLTYLSAFRLQSNY